MTTAERVVSLSLLGIMTLALAPLASAQGFGGQDIDPETRQEIRAALEECRDEHRGDREAMKACAEAVAEEYGIELPHRPHHGRRRFGHAFRSSIEETCGEREHTDEWRTCARQARDSVRETFREHRTNLRDQLKACLELDAIDELKECVRGVRDQIREQFDD